MNEKFGATLFSQGKPAQVIALAQDQDRHSQKFGAKPFAQAELVREVKSQINLWREEAHLAYLEKQYDKMNELSAAAQRLRVLYHDIL